MERICASCSSPTDSRSELTDPRSIHDTKNWDQFKLIDFKPKQVEDYDIDIKIEYCGVCGSDVSVKVLSRKFDTDVFSIHVGSHNYGWLG